MTVSQPPPDALKIYQLTDYNQSVANQLDPLLTQLDERFVTGLTPEHFEDFLSENPERALLVAEYAGRIVGSATVNLLAEQTPDSNVGYLGGVIVDENARGLGIGKKLVEACVSWCDARGLPALALNTETNRPGAIALYEHLGAKAVPYTVGHYEIPVPQSIPLDVRWWFFGDRLSVATPCSGGITNETYFVRTRSGIQVLQKLNSAFPESTAIAADSVATHMDALGWDTPKTTRQGPESLLYTDRNDNRWRCVEFIEADAQPPELTAEVLKATGKMLGSWHKDLASLQLPDAYTGLPHFHDTLHFANSLRKIVPRLDARLQPLATDVLQAFDNLGEHTLNRNQAIHGDPQVANMLFRGGQPYTFIDYDTTMPGSIWLDIGDLVRDVLERDIANKTPISIDRISTIAEAYRAAAAPEWDAQEFIDNVILATKRIALELAMRFMADIADGNNYFSWDTAYANREAYLTSRSQVQWHIYSQLHKLRS